MSSFVKFERRDKIKTGLPLIDRVVEELEPGTMFLIKEDEYSNLHNVLLNTFISEGSDEKKLLVVNESPSNLTVYAKNESQHIEQGLQKMQIAWRYSYLKLDQLESKFDLMAKVEYKGKSLIGLSLNDILEQLAEIKNHRIAIYSLFSPFYNIKEIEKTLFLLKKMVRENNNVCMISIPTFLHENINFDLFFDVSVAINANLLTGLLPNYRATLEIEKISSYGNIRVLNLDSFIFGVRFVKNRLLIENIDIPPDESDPSFSCSAF